MFEVNGTYANRLGRYTVLEVGPSTMKIRYEDGKEAEVKIAIQERIWQNIQAEEELAAPRVRKRKLTAVQNNFFIKSISSLTEEDLTMTNLRDLVSPSNLSAPEIRSGDRFIYYATDIQRFFAVGTITGEPKTVSIKEFADWGFEGEEINVFPIDIDAMASRLSMAVAADSVELDSQPSFKDLLTKQEVYLTISEDDFELLAELLTEISEAEEDEDEDEDEEDDVMDDEDLDIEM